MMRTGCCIHCIHARCLWCAQVSCFGQRGEGDEGDDFMLKVRLSGAVRTMDRLRWTTAVVFCCSLPALVPLWATRASPRGTRCATARG